MVIDLMDDEENESLCERILWDLDNIFKRDLNIQEFDIIEVVESTCNKSPVIYIDHNLALEKWCVPHLYCYAYKKLLNFRQNNINRTDSSLVNQWTRILLLLNPDFTTAWNLRRDHLLKSANSSSYLEELRFTELIIIRKPKCASVYSYREWLLNNYLSSTDEFEEGVMINELKITLDAADRYSRNYYAWSHRTWILTVYIKDFPLLYILNKIIADFSITGKWLEKHISDYSCMFHRQCLYRFIFKLEKNFPTNVNFNPNGCPSLLSHCKELFLQEFNVLNNLWDLYPEQESLYLHRRFLLHHASIWCPKTCIDSLKEQENHFYHNKLKKLSKECPENSWQNELIRRYLLYLKRNLNWSFDSLIQQK